MPGVALVQQHCGERLNTAAAEPWRVPWSGPCTVGLRGAFPAAHRACGLGPQPCQYAPGPPCDRVGVAGREGTPGKGGEAGAGET